VNIEKLLFTAELLAPKHLLINEISKNASRKNLIAEQATMFWVPKSLISFQLQEILVHSEQGTQRAPLRNYEHVAAL
jgi:hypothetical protein